MLSEYVRAAMRRAEYKFLDDDRTFYGSIPAVEGVWANADTLEACRDELQEVLEGWILFSVRKDLPIPELDGLTIQVTEVDRV